MILRYLRLALSILIHLSDFIGMNKSIKIILEIVKVVVSALLGYFGGNAVM